ncbi:Kelch repeat-containing protein [Planctomycetaceae bacterium SH139]
MMPLKKNFLVLATLLALSSATQSAVAHFPWLVRGEDGKAVLFFSEDPSDRSYKLPPSIKAAEIRQLTAGGEMKVLPAESIEQEDLFGLVSKQQLPADATLVTQVTFGIYHGARLDYYAAHLGGSLPQERQAGFVKQTGLDLVAEVVANGKGVDVFVTWQGKPLADVEVQLYCDAGHQEGVADTDAEGKVSFSDKEVEEGMNAIMLGHKLSQAGSLDDKAYESASHYLTMTFFAPESADDDSTASLAPLPFEITSFGAARTADAIYVYGGHTGSAHSYSTSAQSNKLLKLDLNHPSVAWQELSEGPRLQGLGMVAHDQRLILVGGFTAKNAEGEEHDLHSQADVKAFDLTTKQWSDLPALPEPRSSHDAALIGDTLYVVGGWQLAGDADSTWHTTAWSLNLADKDAQWQAITEPPFVRRALATVAHQDKLFVIGGMNQKGGPTKDVAVYDPKTNSWDQVTELLGEQSMAGFGAAGWSHNGKLVVTTYEGDIQCYDDAKQIWRQLGKTADARFFHRLLPLDQTHLVSIGGANMEAGKYLDLETVPAGE